MKYQSKIGINWPALKIEDPNSRRALHAKIQEFLNAPNRPEVRAALAKAQEFATAADFPASVLNILKSIQFTDNFDNSYEDIFDMIDISGTQRNGIEVAAVTDALVFQKVLEGEKAKVYQMAGSKVSITCDMYGGGLSWSRRLIDDQEYWTLENNAVAFRNKYYSTKAANFYALIEAIGAAQNIAWQAPVPAALAVTDATYVANRDIQTLNAAAQNILLNVANFGLGVTPQNASFIVLAPLQLQTRLRMALGLNLQQFAQSPAFVNYNFRLLTTMMLGATDVYYVILPKFGIIGLNRMDMTIYSDFDPLSYSDLSVGWGRYGGGIVDQEQLQRCATA
ncbi:MAG: hypothetical protein WC455_27335 [Dehalococcoidia bacterium]|jgi:nitroreductase